MRTALQRAALAVAIGLAGTAQAEVNLPSTIAWSAYGVGSGGYNQAVAIGNALKQKYNVSLRVRVVFCEYDHLGCRSKS